MEGTSGQFIEKARDGVSITWWVETRFSGTGINGLRLDANADYPCCAKI